MMSKSKDNSESKPDTLIDENLKKVYSDIAGEELPDRFKDLLSQLKQQDLEGDQNK